MWSKIGCTRETLRRWVIQAGRGHLACAGFGKGHDVPMTSRTRPRRFPFGIIDRRAAPRLLSRWRPAVPLHGADTRSSERHKEYAT